MIYGYIRVSSDRQTVENQRFEIERFCRQQNLAVMGWIEETISGTQPYKKRALGRLLRVSLKTGKKVWKWNNYCRIERILSKKGTNVTKQLHFYAQKLHLLIKKR